MSQWAGIDEFVAVAMACSFKQGARALGMSPTFVSRAIMQLEQRIQTQLFHRTTRTVRLTDSGRIFFEQCQRIAQERDEAIAQISEKGEPQGELRVTCATAMGERFVAPLIRRFAMRYPKLSVTIDLSNHLVDLIGEGYDLAIRTRHVADHRLIATRVASRSLHTCAAPDYLSRHGRPRTVADLRDHECLVGTSTAWHFQVGTERVDHKPVGRFRCNSGHAVMEACIAGLGICQLPDFYIASALQHGMVELLLEDVQPEDEPIWAVYPRRRHLMPKITAVLECLEHELGSVLSLPLR